MLDPEKVIFMNRGLIPLLLVLTAFGVQARAQVTKPSDTELLPAPQQKAPANNAGLPNNYVRLEWAPVGGAAAYGVEIDCLGCCEQDRWCSETRQHTQVEWMVQSPYLFPLLRGRAGIWRVWAVDQTGRMGKVSDWLVVGIAGGKDLPPLPPQSHVPPQKLPVPMVLRVARPVDTATGEPCAWPVQNPPPKEVTPPKPVYTPDPEYSNSARRARINGQARAVLEVGPDGTVKRACLLEAVQPDLGEQAIQTARRWRFQPALKDGRPVSYETLVEFAFNIDPWRQN